MNQPSKRTTILVPKHYHCSWKVHAAEMGISMNEFALRALYSAFSTLGIKSQEHTKPSQVDMFTRM